MKQSTRSPFGGRATGTRVSHSMNVRTGTFFVIALSAAACAREQAPPPSLSSKAVSPEPEVRVHPSECQVIRKRFSIELDSSGNMAHPGVDFGFCREAVVLAVGEGEVVTVLDVKSHESDLDFSGTVVTILHELPGPEHIVVVINYFHLGKVLVRRKDHVHRGQVIAEPYVSSDGGWIPIVYLEVSGSQPTDPLTLVKSCESRANQDELIYPVPC